jgi:hypothetical protein
MGKVNKRTQKVNPGKPARPLNGETLRAAVLRAVGRDLFAGLKRQGNTARAATDLVVRTVLWVWSDQKTLTGAFREVNRWTIDVLGRSVLGTDQRLLGALTTWTPRLLPIPRDRLHRLMERDGADHLRVGGRVPLAVDGTRVGVPRTRANEAAFRSQTYGRSRTAAYRRKRRRRAGVRARRGKATALPQRPQVRVTLLWHMGLQMPWDWQTGPAAAGERAHFEGPVTGARRPGKCPVLRGCRLLRIRPVADRPRAGAPLPDPGRGERHPADRARVRPGGGRDRLSVADEGGPAPPTAAGPPAARGDGR